MAAKVQTVGTRTRDGRPTREAILEAAARLIHVNGYNNTSLDDVLRDSGVGKGNFYYHFRSKEELGYAILDQIAASFLSRTLDPCFSDPGVPPLVQIHCFLDRVLDTQRERNCVGGCPMGNLASELSDVHEGFRTRLTSVFGTLRARLALAIREAQGRGSVAADCSGEAIAQFLVASIEGAILMTKLTKDITVMEACVDELKRYLAGYQRPT